MTDDPIARVRAVCDEMSDGVSPECTGFAEQLAPLLADVAAALDAKDAEIERLREHLALLAEAIPYDPECMACTSGDYRVRDGEHPLHCAMRTAAEYQEDSDD